MIMLLAILDLKGILFAPWSLLAVRVCGFPLSNQANVRIVSSFQILLTTSSFFLPTPYPAE
jgi:hypothetical protein